MDQILFCVVKTISWQKNLNGNIDHCRASCLHRSPSSSPTSTTTASRCPPTSPPSPPRCWPPSQPSTASTKSWQPRRPNFKLLSKVSQTGWAVSNRGSGSTRTSPSRSLKPSRKWWKTWTTRWSTGENELLSLLSFLGSCLKYVTDYVKKQNSNFYLDVVLLNIVVK